MSSIQSIEYRENRIMSNTVIYDYIVHTIVHTINFIIIAKLLFLSLNLSHILSRINNVISKMCLRVPEKKIIILSYILCWKRLGNLPSFDAWILWSRVYYQFFSDKFPWNILYMIWKVLIINNNNNSSSSRKKFDIKQPRNVRIKSILLVY